MNDMITGRSLSEYFQTQEYKDKKAVCAKKRWQDNREAILQQHKAYNERNKGKVAARGKTLSGTATREDAFVPERAL